MTAHGLAGSTSMACGGLTAGASWCRGYTTEQSCAAAWSQREDKPCIWCIWEDLPPLHFAKDWPLGGRNVDGKWRHHCGCKAVSWNTGYFSAAECSAAWESQADDACVPPLNLAPSKLPPSCRPSRCRGCPRCCCGGGSAWGGVPFAAEGEGGRGGTPSLCPVRRHGYLIGIGMVVK
eukprot:Sspe_Gene.62070::Locus_34643_Transcript_1_1_Confidence_1.000_Length_1791::g.62070::m.62070